MQAIVSTPNSFGGVVTNSESLPDDPAVFEVQLRYSLSAWRSKDFKVVWLEIPISKASLVPVAVEAGFTFHHAKETYVLLTNDLVEGSYIPPYATHYIGVGGVVLNHAKELLVVSERHRRDRSDPSYKLPGGALRPGEDLVEGVVREVLEETGIRTQFESLACFRHWHGYRFGNSDIYFVCRLEPLSLDISMQIEEIEECLWMPLEAYLKSQSVSSFNKLIVRSALERPGIVPTSLIGYYDDQKKREFFMQIDGDSG